MVSRRSVASAHEQPGRFQDVLPLEVQISRLSWTPRLGIAVVHQPADVVRKVAISVLQGASGLLAAECVCAEVCAHTCVGA